MDARAAELLQDLRKLQGEMRDYLTLVGGEETTVAQLAGGWARCERSTELFSQVASVAPEGSEERRELIAELEVLQRLNAIVAAAVARKRAETAERLSAVRSTTRRLGYYDSSRTVGESCDIPG